MSVETYNPLLKGYEVKADAVREFNKNNKEQLNKASDQTDDVKKIENQEQVEKVTLQPKTKEDFLRQFNNLGVSLGFSGGTRDKLRDTFDKAEFHKAKDAVVITKNSQEENSYQITFNGNCDKVAAIPLGHDCYIKATYDKEKGTVGIVSSTIFHIKDGKETAHTSIFGKDGTYDLLINKLGERASEVLHNFNNMKVLVCANPQDNQKNAEEHSVSGVAALIDGKTHGVQAGRKTMLAGAVVCGILGAGAAVTGFGAPATVGLLSAATALTTASLAKIGLKDYGPRLENSSAILVKKDSSNSDSVTIEKQSVISKGQENQKNNSNSNQENFSLSSPAVNNSKKQNPYDNIIQAVSDASVQSFAPLAKTGDIISKIYEWFFPPKEKPKTAITNHNIINITRQNNADNNQTQLKDSTKQTESEAVFNPLNAATKDISKQNTAVSLENRNSIKDLSEENLNELNKIKKNLDNQIVKEAVLNPLDTATMLKKVISVMTPRVQSTVGDLSEVKILIEEESKHNAISTATSHNEANIKKEAQERPEWLEKILETKGKKEGEKKEEIGGRG